MTKPDPKELGAKLEKFRLSKHLTQAQLAETLSIPGGFDVSSQSIGKYEAGKTYPKSYFFRRFRELFGFDLETNEQFSSNKKVPVYETSAIGGNEMVADMSGVQHPVQYIDVGDILAVDTEMAMFVHGNSMIPNYPPGCMVGLVEVKDRAIAPGEVYVLETDSDRWIKRVFMDKSDRIYTLYSDNTMKFDVGPREGQWCFPPFDLDDSKVRRIFKITGVIKRNASGPILRKNQNR